MTWPRIWLARMTSRFSERIAVGQQGRFLTELCGNHFLNHRLGLKAGGSFCGIPKGRSCSGSGFGIFDFVFDLVGGPQRQSQRGLVDSKALYAVQRQSIINVDQVSVQWAGISNRWDASIDVAVSLRQLVEIQAAIDARDVFSGSLVAGSVELMMGNLEHLVDEGLEITRHPIDESPNMA